MDRLPGFDLAEVYGESNEPAKIKAKPYSENAEVTEQ